MFCMNKMVAQSSKEHFPGLHHQRNKKLKDEIPWTFSYKNGKKYPSFSTVVNYILLKLSDCKAQVIMESSDSKYGGMLL